MVSKIGTICFIGYLFLLAPYGRPVQALVERYIDAQGAFVLAVLCLVGAGFATPRASAKELLTKAVFALVLCLGLGQFILYPVEWSHLAHYAALSILMNRAFQLPALHAIIAASCVGILDESLQGISPGRVFDFRDICLNFVGAAVGISIQRVSTDTLRRMCRKFTN